MSERPAPLAAIFNTSPDTVEMLRTALSMAGIVSVGAYTHQLRDGAVDLTTFMEQHNPDVVVYDIAPPYDLNYQLFLHFRSTPALRSCPVVMTTTNARYVQQLVGPDHRVYEVLGKPFDLDAIVQAVLQAAVPGKSAS
jgi:CheY-like chemotaxis protein